MATKLSEALLSQVPGKPEELSLEAGADDEESTCNQVTYGTGDLVFSAVIVAPLVVGVWRGTWGIMNLHPKLFPFAQTFILGIILHASFAVIRSQLLSRSVEANEPRSPVKWLQERIVSRVYTYVFILANIMHWRGGWGLFDAAVAAIIPLDTDPHRAVLIASLVILFYVCNIFLRSSRNFLAAPFFLVTDGKEPTYIFTTRFRKQVSVPEV